MMATANTTKHLIDAVKLLAAAITTAVATWGGVKMTVQQEVRTASEELRETVRTEVRTLGAELRLDMADQVNTAKDELKQYVSDEVDGIPTPLRPVNRTTITPPDTAGMRDVIRQLRYLQVLVDELSPDTLPGQRLLKPRGSDKRR